MRNHFGFLPTIVGAVFLAGCQGIPSRAGRLTSENIGEIVPPGDTAWGRVGDYFIRNEHATYILQRPGHEPAIGPYGGNIIDVALTEGTDHFGELIPTLALGRTIDFQTMRVVASGHGGESAVIEAEGPDVLNTHYNLGALMPDVLTYDPDGTGVLSIDPEAPLGLWVRVRYALGEDDTRLRVTYTVTNIGEARTGVTFSLLFDPRGEMHAFAPGPGYQLPGEGLGKDDIVEALGLELPSIQQLAYVSPDSAIGFAPTADDPWMPRVSAAKIPQLGTAMLFGPRSVLEVVDRPSFYLQSGESRDLAIDVTIAANAPEVLAANWRQRGQPLVPIDGCVWADDGALQESVRIAVQNQDRGIVVSTQSDPLGCFHVDVPPDDYEISAGAPFRPLSESVSVTPPASEVRLSLARMAHLAVGVDIFDDIDQPVASEHPCRVTLIGDRYDGFHPALGFPPPTDPGGNIHKMAWLRTCKGSVDAPAGRYLAVVSRGPEFDFVQQVVTLRPGATTALEGDLHRVVDSRNHAASDFHVHALLSPDAIVSNADRVLSLAAEGLDFWASTEHDVVFDFQPIVAALGLQDDILTIPGSEVTTFDTGHFGAYPLAVDANHANGGSPNWELNALGQRPDMNELFGKIHQLGALVQINHPRGEGSALTAYFSRAGLSYDPATGAPHADPAAQKVGNTYLRYPQGLSYYSHRFDIIEILNGVHTYVHDGMVYDRGAESAGHDWMNHLSAGLRIVAVGNSDTHTLGNIPGVARTMVGNHDGGIGGLLDALRHGDAIISSGPMVTLRLESNGRSGGLGDLIDVSGGQAILHVRIETPLWGSVDTLEVVANAFFADPTREDEPLPAVPLVHLEPTPVQRANGGQALVATADIAINTNEEPFGGRDGWLIARVGGQHSHLYPVLPKGGGTLDTSADTPEEFLSDTFGEHPYALTNPIFLDGNGDGTWQP